MQCPQCQHDNSTGQKFCGECGARLASACPSCGASNPPAQKFCGECGTGLGQTGSSAKYGTPQSYTPKHLAEKILISRGALEGERKQVTVLFCDITDSTGLAERLGPEPMHGLLNRFFELALAAVHRYEGTINQFLGDGFMALFGAPVAHEDHARRAVLSALELQRQLTDYHVGLGAEMAVRIGVNTGFVVVGSIGDDLRMDYTAVGDTTNVAARLQHAASPGTIAVSETTRRLVHGYVRLEPLGELSLKGKREPVNSYKVIGRGSRRSRVDDDESQNFSSFVGRGRELALLYDLLDLAQQGPGQVVSIVAEAGMGKSRLLREFRRGVAERPITYLEGRCVSYGAATAYLPILDIVRANCRITDEDTPGAVAAKARFALEELGMDADDQLPYLLALLGIKEGTEPLDGLAPGIVKSQIFEVLREMSLKGSTRRPIVFVAEDLHWTDKTSEEYLTSLTERLPGVAILLLTTHRPGYRPTWLDKSYATQIALRPLSRQDSITLIESAGQRGALPERLTDRIVEKADGNPLFLEELTRALSEQAGLSASSTVPETIHSVLAARIDRLPEETKRILQTAAVLGREFGRRLLSMITDAPTNVASHLAELVRLEFLYEQRRADEPVYVFKHVLTQDVAYESLLRDKRRTLHVRVIDAIEYLQPERRSEEVRLLVHHAIKGEVWDKAVDYLKTAGANAYTKGALEESIKHYEDALEITGKLPQSPDNTRRAIDVRLDLHAPSFALGHFDRLETLLREAEQLSRDVNDPPRLGEALHRLGNYAWARAQYIRSIEYNNEALDIASATGDRELSIKTRYFLGTDYFFIGQYRHAIELLRGVVDADDADVARRHLGMTTTPYLSSCSWIAWASAALGEFEQADLYGARGIDAVQRSGHAAAQAQIYLCVATAFALRGDFQQASIWSGRALGLAESKQLLLWLGWGSGVHGEALVGSGRVKEGLTYLERSVMVWERAKLKTALSLAYYRWADGLLSDARPEAARDRAEKGLVLARDLGERAFEAEALHVLSKISATSDVGHLEPAFVASRKAMELATELGMRPLIAHCHLGLGMLYRRTGKRQEAQEHLATATTMYREMAMRFWLEKAEAELRELS